MPGGTPYDGLYGEAPPILKGVPFPCCWMLLRVVAQSLRPVKLFSQQLATFLLFRDRRSVCTALPTLLGPRTFIMHGLQRFIGCILPTMHCRSQHWWPVLHPFVHHCQHARNNSQHCWRNNVGSCCIRLYTTANMHTTTPNIAGATMLGVVASVCTQPKSWLAG